MYDVARPGYLTDATVLLLMMPRSLTRNTSYTTSRERREPVWESERARRGVPHLPAHPDERDAIRREMLEEICRRG